MWGDEPQRRCLILNGYQANLCFVDILSTRCNGIIQADMILKTAIEAGLEELRGLPWLLDFAMQFYLNDELTLKSYGAEQVEVAKNFFLNNHAEVRLDVVAGQAEAPTITITCADGPESWTTLGDVAETPTDSVDMQLVIPRAAALTFTPAGYDHSTGTITLNSKQTTASVYQGMRVFDAVNGKTYNILEVLDSTSFIIDVDSDATPPNLKRAQVVNANDLMLVSLQSATHRESYQIAVECQGDPVNAIILHSCVLFALYRYKNELLHKRGFENAVIGKSGLIGPYRGADSQLFFKRGINIRGDVTHTWPGEIKEPVQGVEFTMGVMVPGSGKTFDDDAEGEPGLTDQGWRVVDPDLDDVEEDTED